METQRPEFGRVDADRMRLAIVLDYDDLDLAASVAKRVQPWFGVAKIGLELWSAAGTTAVLRMQDLGYTVFLDVKLHDIPNTVAGAARVVGRLGLGYLNAHAAGGEAMMRAFVDGAREGAAQANVAPPCLLGVTVLTSEADTSTFDARVETAVAAGCGGVVCSGFEVARVKARHPNLVTVVPGVRLAGSAANDQARVMTPAMAITAGSDVLVVGRTVTAPGPGAATIEAAAQRVFDEIHSPTVA
jgi:orotidine-5'-phosphate decarboxylase